MVASILAARSLGLRCMVGFLYAVNVGLHCIQPNLQQRDDFPHPLLAAVRLGFCWFILINTSMAGCDGETRRLVLSASEAQRLPRGYFLRPQPSTLSPNENKITNKINILHPVVFIGYFISI